MVFCQISLKQQCFKLVLILLCIYGDVSTLYAQNYHGRQHDKPNSQYVYQKSLLSFLQPTIKGSGVVLVNERTVKPFHAICVEDPFRIIIRQSSEHQVRVICDDNLPDFIRIVVSDDGVMSIALTPQNYTFDTLAVVVSSPMIDSIALGFSTDAIVEDPFVAAKLTTVLEEPSQIQFCGGTIRHHTIRLGRSSSRLDASNVEAMTTTLRTKDVAATVRLNTQSLEIPETLLSGTVIDCVAKNGQLPAISRTVQEFGVVIKPIQVQQSNKCQ